MIKQIKRRLVMLGMAGVIMLATPAYAEAPTIVSEVAEKNSVIDERLPNVNLVTEDYVASLMNTLPHTDEPFIEYNIYSPYYKGTKTWMGYQTVTDKSSKQYALLSKSITGNYGIRTVGGRYCIALGSRFNAEIGQQVDLVLENGIIIPCVVGDRKADIHTDQTNTFTIVNNAYCCSEFIVDSKAFRKNYQGVGDVSQVAEEWNSPVVFIRVYKEILY